MITAEMLTPIVTEVTSAVTTILPIGLSIMGAMIGVKLIPSILYRFF